MCETRGLALGASEFYFIGFSEAWLCICLAQAVLYRLPCDVVSTFNSALSNFCLCLSCRYQKESFLDERHRHRYEVMIIYHSVLLRQFGLLRFGFYWVCCVAHWRLFSPCQVNPDMVDSLEAAGLRFVGKDETGRRMEVFLNPLPWAFFTFFWSAWRIKGKRSNQFW